MTACKNDDNIFRPRLDNVLKFIHSAQVQQPILLVDFLAGETDLSKTNIKDCLSKGAVWLRRSKKRQQRVRRAKFQLKKRDLVTIYYDSEILAQPVPETRCVADDKRYSIWEKPAGLLSQGTQYGDHCSLLRVVEKHFGNREVFLVHRLDREASGLVLIAHDRTAAAEFSKLFGSSRTNLVEKWYRVTVLGIVGKVGQELRIEQPLDDKPSCTIARVAAIDQTTERTRLAVRILTGRYHQIRRHLSIIGHPVVGDYRYGKSTGDQLQLQAFRLAFICPISGEKKNYCLEPSC